MPMPPTRASRSIIYFQPETLTVPIGTIETFENQDDMPHSIVATDKSIKSEALDTGDKFTVTFKKAGEIDYFCGLHPHMTGRTRNAVERHGTVPHSACENGSPP